MPNSQVFSFFPLSPLFLFHILFSLYFSHIRYFVFVLSCWFFCCCFVSYFLLLFVCCSLFISSLLRCRPLYFVFCFLCFDVSTVWRVNEDEERGKKNLCNIKWKWQCKQNAKNLSWIPWNRCLSFFILNHFHCAGVGLFFA